MSAWIPSRALKSLWYQKDQFQALQPRGSISPACQGPSGIPWSETSLLIASVCFDHKMSQHKNCSHKGFNLQIRLQSRLTVLADLQIECPMDQQWQIPAGRYLIASFVQKWKCKMKQVATNSWTAAASGSGRRGCSGTSWSKGSSFIVHQSSFSGANVLKRLAMIWVDSDCFPLQWDCFRTTSQLDLKYCSRFVFSNQSIAT